jgi:hypothetical protein
MNLVVGMLVRHPKLGLGKVIKIDDRMAHVFFRDQVGNRASKFQIAAAPLVSADVGSDPWLDNLPPFDEVDGALQLSEKRITQAQALAKFRRLFPRGFDDPAYLGDRTVGERNYKWEKHMEFVELLGGGQGEELLAAGNLPELIKRTRRITSTNMTSIFEKGAFGDALTGGEETRRYFETLFNLLASALSEASVTKYFDAVDGLPQPKGRVATWPVATLMPFLARPDKHMLLKPEVTQEAESRLGFHLSYKPHPNWLTYKKLLELAELLMVELRPLGARDYIDVQSFMWIASKYDESDSHAVLAKSALHGAHDWHADFESPGHKKVHGNKGQDCHKYKCYKCGDVRFVPVDDTPPSGAGCTGK